MSQTNYKNQHLVSNIENTEENRSYVKNINKLAKESESRWRLKIRYRKPKGDKKYGYGGSVKQVDANAFSIYLDDKTPYQDSHYAKMYSAMAKLTKKNISLKKRIAILENPYIQWYETDIEDELVDVRTDIIDRFLLCDDDAHSDGNKLRDKYNLLIQAQEIKKGECNES